MKPLFGRRMLTAALFLILQTQLAYTSDSEELHLKRTLNQSPTVRQRRGSNGHAGQASHSPQQRNSDSCIFTMPSPDSEIVRNIEACIAAGRVEHLCRPEPVFPSDSDESDGDSLETEDYVEGTLSRLSRKQRNYHTSILAALNDLQKRHRIRSARQRAQADQLKRHKESVKWPATLSAVTYAITVLATPDLSVAQAAAAALTCLCFGCLAERARRNRSFARDSKKLDELARSSAHTSQFFDQLRRKADENLCSSEQEYEKLAGQAFSIMPIPIEVPDVQRYLREQLDESKKEIQKHFAEQQRHFEIFGDTNPE